MIVIGDGTACGGRTALVRVVESNSVVESKAMSGKSGQSRQTGRDIWDSGSALTVFGPVKNMLRERSDNAGNGKTRTGTCAVVGVSQYNESREGRLG